MDNDIELEIAPGQGLDLYKVRVIRAASGGEPRASLHLDVPRLLGMRPTLENAVLASAAHARSGRVPEMERPLRDAGQQLFEGLFTGAVRETYRASVAVARERGAKLRVVLHLEAPELAALPWEAMWDPEAQAYLCRKEPLVRHVPAPYTPDPLPVDPPMRILCLVASPRGLPELDVELERQRLDQALGAATADGRIHVEWLVNATWDALQDRLLNGTWHVLHFIGHGDYDPDLDQGRVALVREEDGRADWVEASRLVDLLNEANPTPRLVVLNSCSTGQSGTQDVLSGTAAALVNGGISAVAAMQFRISDPAAVAFPRGFYKALAAGKSVDAALSSGRIAILGRGESLEWVTPVLYMRGGASQLFTVQPATPQTRGTTAHPDQTHPQPEASIPPVAAGAPATAPPPIATTSPSPPAVTDDPRYRRAQAAYLDGDLDEALILFEQIHAEHPTVDIPELATARRKREQAALWTHGATGPTGTTPQSPPSPRRGPAGATPPPPAPDAVTHGNATSGGGPSHPTKVGGGEPRPPAESPAPSQNRRRSAVISALIVGLLLAVGGIWMLKGGGTDTGTFGGLNLRAYMRPQESATLEAYVQQERTARVWAKTGDTAGGTLRVTPGGGARIVDAKEVEDGDGPCRVEGGVAICAFGRLTPDDVRDFTIVLDGSEPGTEPTLTVSAATNDGVDASPQTQKYSVDSPAVVPPPPSASGTPAP